MHQTKKTLWSAFALGLAGATLAAEPARANEQPPAETPATQIAGRPAVVSPKPGDADFPKPSPGARHDGKVAAIKAGEFDLVMIGDSITEAVGDGGDGEWKPLQAVWDKHYAPRRALNLGYSGYRTENILWNLQNGELDFKKSPKVITLLIGTNNTDDQHYPSVHTGEQVFAGTKAIVDLIRQRHPTTKIIILSILPCGGPHDRTAYSRKYNRSATGIAANRRAGELTAGLADGKQVFWLDVGRVFLRPDGSINTDLMPDMIHPNGAGAEARAQAMEPLLAALMGDEPIMDARPNPAAARPVPGRIEIADGPFKPTWESLKQYRCPEWFRDAKLGIWGILTPQSLPEAGDWYARHLYLEGMPQYQFHLQHFGHPSQFGYKDLAALWKLDRFDPDRLMKLYKQAGAKYFVVLANHHDNYDNWDSKYHRWNSVNVGPKLDIVGLWAKAARQQGLRFGVTEHVARSYSWFNTNKGRDQKGALAGVPYDGNDPQYEDLYFPPHPDTSYTYPANPPEWWPRQWFWRIRDLIDTYHPDLMYSDGAVPFGEVGRSLFAHFYNANQAWHGGNLEAVYNLKDMTPRTDHGEYVEGIGVQDVERGILGGIKAEPWQTDTCIGNWFYKTGLQYKPAAQVIGMLADIVSKNGNLLLNIPLKHDGTLDAAEEQVLADLGAWMAVNGEAIYGTRPWQVFGEGRPQGSGHFNEDGRRYDSREIRFTTRGGSLYALVLGWPSNGRARVRSLASGAGTISKVSLLGHEGELQWTQTESGLEAVLPARQSGHHAFALKINGSGLRPVPLPAAVARPDALGRIVLEASDAEIHGSSPRYEQDGGKDQIGYWANAKDFVSWPFQLLRPGTYAVEVAYSCASGAEGSEFVLEAGHQKLTEKLTGKSKATGSWATYTTHHLGQLKFAEPGSYTLAVKPKPGSVWKVIGLKSVVLTPDAGPQPK